MSVTMVFILNFFLAIFIILLAISIGWFGFRLLVPRCVIINDVVRGKEIFRAIHRTFSTRSPTAPKLYWCLSNNKRQNQGPALHNTIIDTDNIYNYFRVSLHYKTKRKRRCPTWCEESGKNFEMHLLIKWQLFLGLLKYDQTWNKWSFPLGLCLYNTIKYTFEYHDF